eukprot:UN24564
MEIKCIFLFVQNVMEKLRLYTVKRCKIVMIMCHPRSGSTNLEECISQHDDISHTAPFDVIAISCFLKRLLYPLKFILDGIFGLILTVPNKKFSGSSMAEEDYIFLPTEHPHLIYPWMIPIFDDFECSVGEYQIQFIVQTIYNSCHFNNKKMHISKPLGYAMYFDLICNYFPDDTKFIIPLRHPKQCIPATAVLAFHVMDKFNVVTEEQFRKYFNELTYETESTKIFENIYNHAGNMNYRSRTCYILFEEWIKNPECDLKRVCEFLNLQKAVTHKKQTEYKNNKIEN